MQTLSSLKIRLSNFQISEEHFTELWKTQKEGKIRLFKLLDLLIVHAYLDSGQLNQIVSTLCRYHLNFYKSHKQRDLEVLAGELEYSRERVKQVKDKLKSEFTQKFSFINHFEWIEEIDINQSMEFIAVDEDQQTTINKNNGTDFTKKFITRVYSVIKKDSFEIIGDEEKKEWSSSYLVNKEVDFDFVKVINEYRTKLRPYPIRKEETILPFDGLGYTINRRQVQVLKQLVTNEFGAGYFTEAGLVLPLTRLPNLEDVLLKTIQDLGVEHKGHHLHTIITALDEVHRREYKMSSIRSTLNGDPRFTCFGKKSTYILSEWLDAPELGLIAGDYGRLCQRLLETEPMPLDWDTLIEKVGQHRNNPIRRSVAGILGSKKEIFQIKGSFVGLVANKEHVEILSVTERIPVKYFSKELWRKLKETDADIILYLQNKKLNATQISYLMRYMERVTNNQVKIDIIEQDLAVNDENEAKRLLSLLAGINSKEDDKYSTTEVRREHVLLKQLLFSKRTEMACGLCGRIYPTRLLAVAHIKRRSMASKEERKNPAIVMAVCYFGCDALYEKGFISVDQNGKIISLNKYITSPVLENYISNLEGKYCSAYRDENRHFFEDHRIFHLTRGTYKKVSIADIK